MLFFGFLAAIPDDVLAGWIESPGKVYTVVRGYFASASCVVLLVRSWFSCCHVVFRSFSRRLKDYGLLEVAPRAARAPKPCKPLTFSFMSESWFFLLSFP